MVNSDDERVSGDTPEDMDTTVSPNEDRKCITIVSSQLSSLNFTTSITSSPSKKPKVNAIDDFMNDLTSESSEDEQFEESKASEKYSVDIDNVTSSSDEDTKCEESNKPDIAKDALCEKGKNDSVLAPFESFKDARNSFSNLTNGVDYDNPQPSGSGIKLKKKFIEEITIDSDDSSVELMDSPQFIKSKGGKSSNPLKIKNSSAKKLFLLKNRDRLRHRDTSSFRFPNEESSNVDDKSLDLSANKFKGSKIYSKNNDIEEIHQVLPFLSREQVEEAYGEYPMCSNRRHVTLSVLIATAESDGNIVSSLAYQKLVSWSKKRKIIDEGSESLNGENPKRFALNEAHFPNKRKQTEYCRSKDNEANTHFKESYRKPRMNIPFTKYPPMSAQTKAILSSYSSPANVLYAEEEAQLYTEDDDDLFPPRCPLQDDAKLPSEDDTKFPSEDNAKFLPEEEARFPPEDEARFPPEEETRFPPEEEAYFPPEPESEPHFPPETEAPFLSEEETMFPPDEIHIFPNNDHARLPPEDNAPYGHHQEDQFEEERRPLYNELMYPDEMHDDNLNVNGEQNDGIGLELIEPLPVVEPTPLPYVGGVDREREQWINEKVELATAILARRIPEHILRNRITDCFSDLDFNQVLEELLHNDMHLEYPLQPTPEPEMEVPEEERPGPSGVNQRDRVNQNIFDEFLVDGAANNDVEPANQQGGDQQTEDYGAVLCDMFPDGDPDFLTKRGEALKGNPLAFEHTVMDFTEKGEYPKMEEFIKRKKRQEEKEKFLNAIDAKEFLELMEDPEKVFLDTTKEVSDLYKKNAKEHLANIFPSVLMSTIIKTLQQVNHHLYPAYKALEVKKQVSLFSYYLRRMPKQCKRDKCKRKSNRRQELLSESIDDLFLKEVCFLKLEADIKNYRNDQVTNREKELQMAKQRGLLQTCPICCEDEILQEEMRPCDADSPHFFCKNCVRRHTEAQIGLGSLHFQCLEGECEEVFSLEVLKTVLKSSVFSNVLKRKQNMEIKAAGIPGLETCAFCDFATVISNKEDKVFHCQNPECLKDSCRFCKKPSHIPLNCEEARDKIKTDTRTYLENEMSEAIVRECYKCGNRFIKEDGCNKMKCMCGAIMCYLCKKQLKDSYEHFYDSNRHSTSRPQKSTNRCPLWSNSLELHAQEVKVRAQEAKKNIDPNVELEHDPTQDLPKEPERQRQPPGAFPRNNQERRMRVMERMRQRRMFPRPELQMDRIINFNIGNQLHFMNDPPLVPPHRDRPRMFRYDGGREDNGYDIFEEQRAAAMGMFRDFDAPLQPPWFPERHVMHRPFLINNYIDPVEPPRPPRIPNERPPSPLRIPPYERLPSPPLIPHFLPAPANQPLPNAADYEHERRIRRDMMDELNYRRYQDPLFKRQAMGHGYNEPLNLTDINRRRNRGKREEVLGDRPNRIARPDPVAPPEPVAPPPSPPDNVEEEEEEEEEEEIEGPRLRRNEAFRRFPNYFGLNEEARAIRYRNQMLDNDVEENEQVVLPPIADVDEAANEPCHCSVQCKGICLNHGIPNSIRVTRKSGVATAWDKKPSWNPRRMIERLDPNRRTRSSVGEYQKYFHYGDMSKLVEELKRNKSGSNENERGIKIPEPMPGGSGIGSPDPMPGGSGIRRNEPMPGGSGIARPEPLPGGSGFNNRDNSKFQAKTSSFSPVKMPRESLLKSISDESVSSKTPRMHHRSKSFTAGSSKSAPATDGTIYPISLPSTVSSNKISVLKQIVGSKVVEQNGDNSDSSVYVNSSDSSDVE